MRSTLRPLPPKRTGRCCRQAAGGLFLTVLSVAACTPESQWPTLGLEELKTLPLPDGYVPRGIAVADDGAMLVWGLGQSSLLYFDPSGRSRPIETGSNVDITAASFIGATTVEFLAETGRRIGQLSINGDLLGERFLGSWVDSSSVVAATSTRDGWFVLIRSRAGDLLVARESDSTLSGVLHRVNRRDYSQHLPDSMAQLAGHIAVTPHGLILTLSWPPFESFVLDLAGSRLTTLRPQFTAYRIDTTHSASAIVALPALALDRGFVQTFADLRSDRRDLVLFDENGNEVRRTSVDAPIGFVARAPSNVLVAVRQAGVTEVVLYRWTWGQLRKRS